MSELEKLFGPVGLGLIVLFLPYFFQFLKMVFPKLEGPLMLWITVGVTYILVDLLYVATVIKENPNLSLADALIVILGMLIYPLLVWFATQGVYTKLISPTQTRK